MRYFAVNGPESVTLSSERALTKGNQYAFYSFTKTVYNARLTNYAHLLNVDALWESVADLTRPFVGTNPDIVEEYKHFFQSYGSHVIVSGNYGARFQLVSTNFSICDNEQCRNQSPVERVGFQ
jgi:hypothetical protein